MTEITLLVSEPGGVLDVVRLIDLHLEHGFALTFQVGGTLGQATVDGDPQALVREVLRLALYAQRFFQVAQQQPHLAASTAVLEAARMTRALRPHLT